MNPNRVSLGGGLCLLSLAVLVHAGVQWASATQPVASADGRNPWRVERPKPAERPRRTANDSASAMPMRGGDGCQIPLGEPLNWFGPIRPIGVCDRFGGVENSCFPMGEWPWYADVNRDGRGERFRWFDHPILPALEPCLVAVEDVAMDGDELLVERSCVLSTQQLADWIQANTNWASAYVNSLVYPRWSDLDNDGDLDLAMQVYGSDGPNGRINVWLENTGFEATQPLTGDLDGDGAVGASDLTMLLGGWTGN